MARGVVYFLIGGTALSVAADHGELAGGHGALRTIAKQPLGNVLLVIAAVGFVGYAAWRLLQAGKLIARGPGLVALGKAVFCAARGALYGLAAWSAAGIALTVKRGEPSNSPILALPPPSALLIGVALIGTAVFLAYRGFARDFDDDLRTDEMRAQGRRFTLAVGLVGYVSRAVAIGVLGWVMVSSGIGLDRVDDLGLDRGLAELLSAAAGRWLLGALGLGLIAFGLFSFVETRYRRIELP